MTTPRTLTDEQLLRRFEPILRFTEGELFFPMPTDGYVAGCDLLVGEADRGLEVVVPHGELSLERLGEVVEPAPGKVRFMRFVQEPLEPGRAAFGKVLHVQRESLPHCLLLLAAE